MTDRQFRINTFRLTLCRIDRAIRSGRPYNEDLICEAQDRADRAGLFAGSLRTNLSGIAEYWKDGRPDTARKIVAGVKEFARTQYDFDHLR
jgi:hypothetical protein